VDDGFDRRAGDVTMVLYDGLLYCEVCAVKVSGVKPWKQHIAGKQHAHKYVLQQQQRRVNESGWGTHSSTYTGFNHHLDTVFVEQLVSPSVLASSAVWSLERVALLSELGTELEAKALAAQQQQQRLTDQTVQGAHSSTLTPGDRSQDAALSAVSAPHPAVSALPTGDSVSVIPDNKRRRTSQFDVRTRTPDELAATPSPAVSVPVIKLDVPSAVDSKASEVSARKVSSPNNARQVYDLSDDAVVHEVPSARIDRYTVSAAKGTVFLECSLTAR